MNYLQNININSHLFILPAVFTGAVSSVLATGFQITSKKPGFFSTIYGFLVGGVYGLAVGGMWPLSITYLVIHDMNDFFKRNQIGL